MPRRGCQGPAPSCVRPRCTGSVLPPPPPPPPGRTGLRSSEPSGGLGTGPDSSVPPRCVAGCGFIILIDSSCSPTPWGPRPRKGGRGGICGPLSGLSPPAAPQAAGPSMLCCWRLGRAGRKGHSGLCPPTPTPVGREGTKKERSRLELGIRYQGASPGPQILRWGFCLRACPLQRFWTSPGGYGGFGVWKEHNDRLRTSGK